MTTKPKIILAAWLAGLCLVSSAGNLPAAVSQWEPEIRAFENRDRTNPPPQDAVLFLGSSSIRKWSALAKDFPGVRVINRGFGGSEIHDSTEFAGRIVFPYHPRIIVFYAGDNDLAAGKSPDQVVAEYTNFIATIHAQLPATRIVFLSIKASWLSYVDIYSLMLGADGKPRKDLFLKDGLHPNEKAYRLWAAKIRPLLNAGEK